MDGKTAFEEFVITRSPALLRISYGLTRDHANAEDLLQTALARTWPAWKRISGDPEPYVRKVLVNTYASWWRRRWNGERPSESLPERAAGNVPQSTVDDRDEIWRALDRLPKRQRAVVVLRYFEDLTEADIAATLNMAPGTVKSYAAKALAALRRDASLTGGDSTITERLASAPVGAERLAGVNARITTRRRLRTAITAAAVIVIAVLLLTGFPLLTRHTAPPITPTPKQLGPAGFPDYYSGYRIVAGQQITRDSPSQTITWTPSTLDMAFVMMCKNPAKTDIMYGIEINGQPTGFESCNTDGELRPSGMSWFKQSDLPGMGITPGMPATLRVLVAEDPKSHTYDPSVLPPGAVAAIGVGERVPFSQYPLPDRPAQLKPLGNAQGLGGVALGPQRSQTTVHWGQPVGITADSQTPCLMEIRINGALIKTEAWYDYDAVSHGFDLTESDWAELQPQLPAGTPVTLTVTSQYGDGDWYAIVGSKGVHAIPRV